MHLERVLSVSVIVAMASGLALAQTPRKPPLDQGAARAQATALIRDAKATDLFVAGASAAGPLAQHMKSNLVCHFEPGSTANHIAVFDEGPNRGDDVGCRTQFENVNSTLFAVRVKPGQDIVKTETQSLAEMRQRFPDLTEYKGPATTVKDKNRPPMAISRVTTATGQRFIRATAFQIGNWIYSQTIDAPTASAQKADQYAEIQLSKLITEIKLGRPS